MRAFLNFDDTVVQSLARIEESLDSAWNEVETLATMMSCRLDELVQEDPKYEELWAQFSAVVPLAPAINSLKLQTAAALYPEDQQTAV